MQPSGLQRLSGNALPSGGYNQIGGRLRSGVPAIILRPPIQLIRSKSSSLCPNACSHSKAQCPPLKGSSKGQSYPMKLLITFLEDLKFPALLSRVDGNYPAF
jgi:hypothetical protein